MKIAFCLTSLTFPLLLIVCVSALLTNNYILWLSICGAAYFAAFFSALYIMQGVVKKSNISGDIVSINDRKYFCKEFGCLSIFPVYMYNATIDIGDGYLINRDIIGIGKLRKSDFVKLYNASHDWKVYYS